MVICVLFHRLALLAALGDRRALITEPVALAPEAGREQVVGEVSPRAEAFGVVLGMRVGEALSRCPELRLVPPDPEAVRELWNELLDRLEKIGAAVESDRPGAAYFEAAGIERLLGGVNPQDSPRASRGLDGVLAAARRAAGRSVRLGAGPSRFAAYAVALEARPRRGARSAAPAGLAVPAAGGALMVPAPAARAFLAPRPVTLLRVRPELLDLCDVLGRLGIRTLGELAALPAPAVAERFGPPGLRALQLAGGGDTPLEPRRPTDPVTERLELPEAASGPQLARALELLLARLLARPERRGRTVRALALSARLAAGGGWRVRATLRSPSAEAERIGLVLGRKLEELPAPAATLGLEVEAFGPPAYGQEPLLEEDRAAAARRGRLRDAVRQARQAAGSEAALRVLEIDPDSRVPERRAALAPFPTGDEQQRE